MIYAWLVVILICFLPIFELRLAIPVGILFLELNPFMVFLVSVISNFAVGIFVYYFLEGIVKIGCMIPFCKKIYEKTVIRTQKKIETQMDKFGWIGLSIFIGIPLPGSGVYTGAIVGEVLGMSKKKFAISCLIGVIVSGLIMLILSLFFSEVLSFVGISKIESVKRLFKI